MKKILVPTDFSANSKAGLKFALQWSAWQKLELVVVHVFQIVRLPYWTDANFSKYVDLEKKDISIILKNLLSVPVKA